MNKVHLKVRDLRCFLVPFVFALPARAMDTTDAAFSETG
jgi:hypothetical protein